jgi:hypothetical protein
MAEQDLQPRQDFNEASGNNTSICFNRVAGDTGCTWLGADGKEDLEGSRRVAQQGAREQEFLQGAPSLQGSTRAKDVLDANGFSAIYQMLDDEVKARDASLGSEVSRPSTGLLAAAAMAEKEVRHLLERDLVRLREENALLKQKLGAALETLAQQDERFEEAVRGRLEQEMRKFRPRTVQLQQRLEQAERELEELARLGVRSGGEKPPLEQPPAPSEWTEAKDAPAAELLKLATSVQRFLTESYQALSGSRSVCVELEVSMALNEHRQGPPPPLFDPLSADLGGSLMLVPALLRYITSVLLKTSVQIGTVDSKWRRSFCGGLMR